MDPHPVIPSAHRCRPHSIQHRATGTAAPLHPAALHPRRRHAPDLVGTHTHHTARVRGPRTVSALPSNRPAPHPPLRRAVALGRPDHRYSAPPARSTSNPRPTSPPVPMSSSTRPASWKPAPSTAGPPTRPPHATAAGPPPPGRSGFSAAPAGGWRHFPRARVRSTCSAGLRANYAAQSRPFLAVDHGGRVRRAPAGLPPTHAEEPVRSRSSGPAVPGVRSARQPMAGTGAGAGSRGRPRGVGLVGGGVGDLPTQDRLGAVPRRAGPPSAPRRWWRRRTRRCWSGREPRT